MLVTANPIGGTGMKFNLIATQQLGNAMLLVGLRLLGRMGWVGCSQTSDSITSRWVDWAEHTYLLPGVGVSMRVGVAPLGTGKSVLCQYVLAANRFAPARPAARLLCYRQWCFYLSTLSHGLCRGISCIFNAPSVESRCLLDLILSYGQGATLPAASNENGIKRARWAGVTLLLLFALKLQHIGHLREPVVGCLNN